jgi:hypothetical protein
MSLAPQNLVDKKWTMEISLTQPEMKELHEAVDFLKTMLKALEEQGPLVILPTGAAIKHIELLTKFMDKNF